MAAPAAIRHGNTRFHITRASISHGKHLYPHAETFPGTTSHLQNKPWYGACLPSINP